MVGVQIVYAELVNRNIAMCAPSLKTPTLKQRLGYSLDFADNLSMSVGGFSDKLPELMEVGWPMRSVYLATFGYEWGCRPPKWGCLGL